MPHSVPLILPRGFTTLVILHSLLSVGQPPGVTSLFWTNSKKTLESQARVHQLKSSHQSTTQQEKLRSLVVGYPWKMAASGQGVSGLSWDALIAAMTDKQGLEFGLQNTVLSITSFWFPTIPPSKWASWSPENSTAHSHKVSVRAGRN